MQRSRAAESGMKVSDMSILKWKDFNDMLSIRDEVDRLFNKMFQASNFHSWEERFSLMSSNLTPPQFSTSQKGDTTIIRVDLPGFDKGDIKVSVSGNLLAIGSEVSREREFKGDSTYGYQRTGGSFYRVMELPADADTNRIASSFSNGVLEITIPRIGGIAPEASTHYQPQQPAIPENKTPALPTGSMLDNYDDEEE